MNSSTDSSSLLFDSHNLRSRLMGDDELVAQVLEACVPDINANFRDFVEAIEHGNLPEATMRIHAMKGASQNADLSAVSSLTSLIEASLRKGQSSFAQENVAALEELVGETMGAVRSYLSRSA